MAGLEKLSSFHFSEAYPSFLFTIVVKQESSATCAVVDKWKLFTKGAEEIIKFFGLGEREKSCGKVRSINLVICERRKNIILSSRRTKKEEALAGDPIINLLCYLLSVSKIYVNS